MCDHSPFSPHWYRSCFVGLVQASQKVVWLGSETRVSSASYFIRQKICCYMTLTVHLMIYALSNNQHEATLLVLWVFLPYNTQKKTTHACASCWDCRLTFISVDITYGCTISDSPESLTLVPSRLLESEMKIINVSFPAVNFSPVIIYIITFNAYGLADLDQT